MPPPAASAATPSRTKARLTVRGSLLGRSTEALILRSSRRGHLRAVRRVESAPQGAEQAEDLLQTLEAELKHRVLGLVERLLGRQHGQVVGAAELVLKVAKVGRLPRCLL